MTTPAPAAAREAGASSLLLFAVPTFIWGTTWLVIKFQLGLVAPEVSVAWRFALASALLLSWGALRGARLRYAAADHLSFALLGVLLFGLNYVLVYRAEATLTSGLVAVLFAFMVFWNLAGARLFFGTPAPPAVLLGAVLGVSGVGLLFWPEVRSVRGDAGLLTGVAYAAGGTVVAAGGNLLSQRIFARGVAVVPATAYAMGYAALLVAGWCVATGTPFTFDWRTPYVASLLYLALFGSVVAFVSYLTLLRRIGAGRAGYSTAVIPVVAMLASTLFEGYRWTATAAAGLGLVLAGTVLVLRAKERAARA
ncbi:MAG: EamA family transporter [Anaeromyxobacter sp.]|nr:EamA family transporter [Anaeromyxobacter sp.]MBL0276868.1 EamA family transporter [Anaeromyxobacter sp.]